MSYRHGGILISVLVGLATSVGASAASNDSSGLVDVGGGRKIYFKCRGAGSPTVVLISGRGNGAADWNEILDPLDPVHAAPTDLLALGQGKLVVSDKAVLPSVSRFTRVCAYDRPGIRMDGQDVSTPVPQPHAVDRAVDDLHRLLTAAGEPGPYVFVAHSYGGLIAMLYTRTYPGDVAGLVMVDTVTELMKDVASPKAVAEWDAHNRISIAEAPESVELLDAFAKIEAAPARRELPAVVLSADKPWPDIGAAQSPATKGAMVTFADWLASEELLAKSLDAPRIKGTNSGHNIYQYEPQLVVDAIREVVDAVRAGKTHIDR
jgi:pimeloyl-ACP methyl ester carboxylesterase